MRVFDGGPGDLMIQARPVLMSKRTDNVMMKEINMDISHTDIAVIGMAGRFPGAARIDEFWSHLRRGQECLTSFTEEDLRRAGVSPSVFNQSSYVRRGGVLPEMEYFDADFFGFSPRDAEIMDPQHRHFLECAWEALEDAGHLPDQFDGSIGVFAGSGHHVYLYQHLLTHPELLQAYGFFLLRHTGNDKDFLSTRVSYVLNLHGPSVNIQTACSSSLVAIHTAAQSLLNRECDMALAGGVSIELPHHQGYVYREGEVLSADGYCRSFDAHSKGTVFSSGVGILVLRRLSDALADGDMVRAVMKGSAINNDGQAKVGYLAPSVEGQAQVIAEALAVADVRPETVSYIEAHGTGTPLGDAIEMAALRQVFRQSTPAKGFCAVGSVKSNIGHTDTAAGVIGVIKVVLALQHRELPPSLGLTRPSPQCEFEDSPFFVNTALRPWEAPAGGPRRAGVTSLGVGGTNAHAILEEAPLRETSGPSRKSQLLVLSAKTTTALEANTHALAQHCIEHPELNLADAAHTLRLGRQAMPLRRVLVCENSADAAYKALSAPTPPQAWTDTAPPEGRSTVFMFAGGGAQYPGMGADLYAREPVFRAAVDDCLLLLSREESFDFKSLIFPHHEDLPSATQAMQKPAWALPCLFIIQYAQARLWMSWGVQPSALIGHSMGEYTAALLAGVFTLEDALRLVLLRGRLFATLPPGAMLSVPLAEDALKAIMDPELSMAAVNAPALSLVSGPVHVIESFQKKLLDAEIEAVRLHISVAAHSSMLDPILPAFGEFFSRLELQAPKLPWVSNLDGSWVSQEQATSPAYWVRHLRETVRFSAGVKTLLDQTPRAFLEVGPGSTLATLLRQHPLQQDLHRVLYSMPHPRENIEGQALAVQTLGRLWACGATVHWQAFQGNENRHRVKLPTYRFDHQKHWIDPGQRQTPSNEHPLQKRTEASEWLYQPMWEGRPLHPDHTQNPRNGQRRTVWVFSDGRSLFRQLVMRLKKQGDHVCEVRAGLTYSRQGQVFTIQAGQAAHMNRLVTELCAENAKPDCIYHGWLLTADQPPEDSWAELKRSRRLGFDTLLHLAQAFSHAALSDPIHWCIITDHLQRVGSEGGLIPAKATVLGPCTVIPREFPHIRCQSIDLIVPAPGSWREDQVVQRLLNEPDSPLGEDILAYRAGERWVRSFAPVVLPMATHQPRLRPGGTYLITGGVGGLGLELAAVMARSCRLNLILLGRSHLPPRSEWPNHLKTTPPSDPLARRLQQLIALEEQGAQIMVASVDVAKASELVVVLKEARARFGPIHGLIHAAGVFHDTLIPWKDDASVSQVWYPKIQGLLVLEAAIKKVQPEMQPDFLILFSSISAFVGLPGQVDYASANAFLDAYAQLQALSDGIPTLSINWSIWQDVGMAADLARRLGLTPPRDAHLGHPLVEYCLKAGADEREYSAEFSLERDWIVGEHAIRGGDALIPATGYLEMLRAAFSHRPPADPAWLEFRHLSFVAPFTVKPGGRHELRILFQRLANHWHFHVRSHLSNSSHDAWNGHAQGEVRWVAPTARAPLGWGEIAARCCQRSERSQNLEQHPHLKLGPRWANVLRIDFGEHEALAQLELPACFEEDLRAMPLHPALMDMATAGAQSLVPDIHSDDDFFVPASYAKVLVMAPLVRQIISHIRYRGDQSAQGQWAVYDITVVDQKGRILVDIEGFTMIRLKEKGQWSGASVQSFRAVPALDRPQIMPAHESLAHALAKGILPAEGAEVWSRILGGPHLAQIIVSPMDLPSALRPPSRPQMIPQPSPATQLPAKLDGEAPATELERFIADMWGEMLGVSSVGAQSHFFDLGGHSLLAFQVIGRIKKRTGQTLPLTSLLQAPTVRAFAALLEPSADTLPALAANHSEPSLATPVLRSLVKQTLLMMRPPPLVPRPGPALFFIHDGNGETLLYRTLGLALRHDQAIYGLQPEYQVNGRVAQFSIESMAASHVKHMRMAQPEGPYFLAGLCAGGVIALEMARQLEDAGEDNLWIAIMDAGDVQAKEKSFRVSRQRWQRFLAAIDEVPDDEQGKLWRPWQTGRLGKALPILAQKTVKLARYELASRLQAQRDKTQFHHLKKRNGLGGTLGPASDDLPYLKIYEHAHREHIPRGILKHTHVVLFRATCGDGSAADMPYREKFEDPLFGWQVRVASAVLAEDIPGGHSSMLQKPHVHVLAEKMQFHLDVALRMATQPQGTRQNETSLISVT